MSPSDPSILFVKDIAMPAANELKRALYYRTVNDNGAVEEKSLSLCGFSFFAEVDGLGPEDTSGIDLWSSLDGAHPAVETGGRYELTYEKYLKYLHDKGVNYIRLFLFNPQTVRLYPFVGEFDPNPNFRHVRYHLEQIDTGYIARLTEFVREARDRGIVVCISLCASQVLRPAGFLNGPFYWRNNWNNVIERFTDGRGNPQTGEGGFCDIEPPPAPPAGQPLVYNNNWPVSQKLWFIQHQLYKSVVEATKSFWNVTYEIFNEPFTDTQKVADWHGTVSTWLHDFLKDASGQRTRLVSIAPTNEVLDSIRTTVQGRVDFISLHGSQWGGPSGGPENLCTSSAAPGVMAIADGVQQAITRFRDSGLAVLFDGDSLYWSQRTPTEYVNQVLLRNGCFNFRWNEEFLDTVVIPTQPSNVEGYYCRDALTSGEQTLGLTQRLQLMANAASYNDKVTRLPKSPAPVQKNLTATVQGNVLKLSFGRPAPSTNPLDPDTTPEGYAVYFGPAPDTLGSGTAIFPGTKFFKVQDPANPRFDVPFYSEAATEVYLAVAARNGILLGEFSNVVRVAIPAATPNAVLVSTDLPFRSGAQIPDRYLSGSATFRNTGTSIWKRQYTATDGWTVKTGIYLQCVEVANESGRALVPLPVEQVLPGETVTIPFNRVFLPYSRSPLHFNFGMGIYRVSADGNSSAWGHFGTVYTKLPPDNRPVEVRVQNPKRHATLKLNRTNVSIPAGASYLDPVVLSADPDYWNYDLLSAATGWTANPDTIIRPNVHIETVGSLTTRVVRVSHNSPTALAVNLKVARLDMKDVDNPRRPDTLARGYNLAPGGTAVGSLSRFENVYAISTASSKTPLPAGQALTWEIMLKSGTAPLKQLFMRNSAKVAAQLTTWTNEIWEDLPAGESDPRQLSGTMTFNVGETIKYVKLSNANEQHFHAVHLHTNGSVEVHYNIVLKANAQRAFERVLEVGVSAHTQPVQVDYRALDIVVDV